MESYSEYHLRAIVTKKGLEKLENFYHSDLYLNEHLNPEMLDRTKVNIHSYKIVNGIMPTKFKKTKENLQKLSDDDVTKIIKI